MVGPPCFRSSVGMPQIPGALPFLSLAIARETSGSDGSSQAIVVSVIVELAVSMSSFGGSVVGLLSRSE